VVDKQQRGSPQRYPHDTVLHQMVRNMWGVSWTPAFDRFGASAKITEAIQDVHGLSSWET
jgi:hypothetical protein